MTSVPDITGADLRPTAELEAENEQRIEALQAMGMPEAILNAIALQVRMEALVSVLPVAIQQELDRRYELSLGALLDEVKANATKPTLFVPGG